METRIDISARESAPAPADERAPIISSEAFSLWYGSQRALKDISLAMPERNITAIIGPSGCGKSTYLRALNRMNELIPGVRVQGGVTYRGVQLYGPGVDPVEVRRHIGMVFQKPNPFPKSIYKNISYGPKLNGYRGDMDELVEESLRRAALFDEVKDKLTSSALELSGGQQQRLCIARTLAMQPDVLLMDEPCSALDPIATYRIEDLMRELRKQYTIVIVTHNMQQAARISDYTAFFLAGEERTGELVELGRTDRLFANPVDKRTADYITGRFG